MSRRNDPARIRHAQLVGSATAIRDGVMLADDATIASQREQLPRLWEAIDRLIETIERGV
jgi:hypothetical protein